MQVHDQIIDHPMAWRADEIGGKAGLARPLNESCLTEFDGLIAASRGRPEFEVEPNDVMGPALADLAQQLRDDLTTGRGCAVLTGLDPNRYGEDGYRRLFAFLGQQIGSPAVQSERGDRLGYVRQEKDNQYGRGYISNMELRFHSDFHELLALASVQSADKGGESSFVSGLTLHNIMRERHPELMAPLYEGYFDALMPYYKMRPGQAGLFDSKLPVFSAVEGAVSLVLADHFYQLAARERGEAAPPELEAAIRVLREIADEPGVAARFMLEPGEMVFWRNWAVLHGRTKFENAPNRQRVLMRLWLHAHDRLPAAAPIYERAQKVDRIHAAIAAEGRCESPASA